MCFMLSDQWRVRWGSLFATLPLTSVPSYLGIVSRDAGRRGVNKRTKQNRRLLSKPLSNVVFALELSLFSFSFRLPITQ